MSEGFLISCKDDGSVVAVVGNMHLIWGKYYVSKYDIVKIVCGNFGSA